MFYNNVPAAFVTDAGAPIPTSKYYVYTNGIIRAKVTDNSLHVRPGKNICFVTGADSTTIGVQGVDTVNDMGGGNLQIVLNNGVNIAATTTNSAINNNPIDFILDNASGDYVGGLHRGHPIAGAYDGRGSGITEADCDQAAAPHVAGGLVQGGAANYPIVADEADFIL